MYRTIGGTQTQDRLCLLKLYECLSKMYKTIKYNVMYYILVHYFNSRCVVNIFRGYFAKDVISTPTSWFHLALVFHGPEEGQGITVYTNGTPAAAPSLRGTNHTRNSWGIVLIGRLRTDQGPNYASLMADELTFWNRQLRDEEVEALRDMYLPQGS